MNSSFIPPRLMEGIERYIERGIIPGSFLQAVICNDLCRAVGAADPESLQALPALVSHLYHDAPAACWGSHEAMHKWADRQQVAA